MSSERKNYLYFTRADVTKWRTRYQSTIALTDVYVTYRRELKAAVRKSVEGYYHNLWLEKGKEFREEA